MQGSEEEIMSKQTVLGRLAREVQRRKISFNWEDQRRTWHLIGFRTYYIFCKVNDTHVRERDGREVTWGR